jgi:hypothetical protein
MLSFMDTDEGWELRLKFISKFKENKVWGKCLLLIFKAKF